MVEIKLQDLTKSFSNEVVINSLDLTIKPGEVTALLGPSGCGKTTTLKIIAGLLKPDRGDLLFDEESVIDIPTESREAVLVFQDYLLFPHLNIEENIAFGLKMQGVKEKKRKARVNELLELVNLVGYEDNYPHELSGGQKQRIALARALAINPQVLLLDEPLTNLDANLRGEMQELIRDIHHQEDMTTVFVTHDREEAMLIADQIAVMKEGEIEQYGTPEELYQQPDTRFVTDFFGKANYLTGKLNEEEFIFSDGKLPLNKDLMDKFNLSEAEEVTVMIRPEFINLATLEDSQAQMTGQITNKKFVGERIFYQVDSGAESLEVVALPPSQFSPGEEVSLEIDLENIWFME